LADPVWLKWITKGRSFLWRNIICWWSKISCSQKCFGILQPIF